jgi:hypothetical protein
MLSAGLTGPRYINCAPYNLLPVFDAEIGFVADRWGMAQLIGEIGCLSRSAYVYLVTSHER